MTREPDAAPDAAIEIVVCVPTFRRPDGLRRTLASLAAQTLAQPFAVVVVDNDAADPRGAALAEAAYAEGGLRGRTLVEPVQGNCHAINAAFGAALAAYPAARHLLMIDDDEWAEPEWLARMVRAAERSGAGVVGGPVLPQIAQGGRAALARHPAFRPAYAQSGPVPVIYGSGNCLIRRETFDRLGLPAFDVAYNFLGGGDTDFFVRARHAGIGFHWEAEAVVRETVPLDRTRPRWLALRGLRIGAINYRIECKHAAGPAARARIALKSLAVLGTSLVGASRLLAATGEPVIALHPLAVAFGRCLAALGIEPQPYRAAAPPR